MLVFDASAAVKWFRDEVDSDVARALLASDEALDGVWLPDNCAHEVLSVVRREAGSQAMAIAWGAMMEAGVRIAHIDESLVAQAAAIGLEFGCTHYDALAPAVARMLGGILVSSDERAHAGFPGVRLIG